MRSTLKRRLALLSVLLIAAALALAAITMLDVGKTTQGTNKESIVIIKPQQIAQTSTQQATLQAEHAALVKNLLNITLKDGRVQGLIAGKNYKVVGIAVERIGPPPRSSDAGYVLPHTGNAPSPPRQTDIGHALLVLKVDNKFYAVVMDVPHQSVTAVEERSCYGPLCNS